MGHSPFMLSFPNAKINLGLNILRKRSDGYHDLESCFYPIPWHDVLEIIPSDQFTFNQTGLNIPGNDADNLCIKAYQLLKADFDLDPVKIHLHKVIPMGAGLGGGSSDGAFTLRLLNHVFSLQLSIAELKEYASQLGSDCPFFIENIPAIAKGTGTDLKPFSLDLSEYFIGIKHPGIHVNTKEAYSGVSPNDQVDSIENRLNLPIENWNCQLKNDFEASIFPNYSEIKNWKDRMYEQGAIYASMSGSGSAVYGIFATEPDLKDDFDICKKLLIDI